MAEFPRSPRLTKGALALYDMDSRTSARTIVVFQYNPDQVRRTLANRTPPQGQGGGAAARTQERARTCSGWPARRSRRSTSRSS